MFIIIYILSRIKFILFFLADHYPDRLTFHEGTGDLFFTATRDYYANPYSDATSYIGVLRLKPDPKNPKHLMLIKDLDDPRCLTLYPQKG